MRSLEKKRGVIICLLVAAAVLLLDRLTKAWALQALAEGSKPFIPQVLDLTLVLNRGAAWGLFQGARWIFLILALLVSVLILFYLVKDDGLCLVEALGLGLFLGGALGNAVDRFISGAVVDFLHTLFMDFPVFNVADCGITVGLVLFLIAVLFSPEGLLRGSGE